MDPKGGGPAQNTVELAAVLRKMGHEVSIASLDKPNSPWLSGLDMPCYPLGESAQKYGFSKSFLDWMKSNHRSYDAVLVRGLWQYHGWGTWKALRGSKTPYYIFPHGMLDPWFNKEYPLKWLKKAIYWLWGERRVLRDAKGVFFTSEEERRLARSSFWPHQVKEITVPYGIKDPGHDLRAFQDRFLRAYPQLSNKKIILFLGRIHPKKGCDILLRSAADVLRSDPEYCLVIAGPDQVGWKDKLQKLAGSLDISQNVTWTDMVAGDLKWGALASAEVLVLPSHQENFGIVVAEALAASLPVIISNKVNIWERIKSSGAGFVCDDRDDSLKPLLEAWTGLPFEEKRKIKEKARRCFLDNFTIEKEAQGILSVIQSKP